MAGGPPASTTEISLATAARSPVSARATSGPGSMAKAEGQSATTSVTPGTRSMMIRWTPAFSVMVDTGQVPHAPTSSTWTTPASSTSLKTMSPPSAWSAGRIASIASRMPVSMVSVDIGVAPPGPSNPQTTAPLPISLVLVGSASDAVDVGAEAGEGADEVRVGPVDVVPFVHHGAAVTPEAGERERGTGPHVQGPHRGTREPGDAPDHRIPPLGAHVGAHADELVDEREAVVEHVLGDDRGPVTDGQQGDRHRHEVGGEPRVRQSRDVDRAQPLGRRRPDPVRRRRHAHAHLAELHDDHLEVLEAHAFQLDLATRDAARHEERPGFDAVTHDLGLARYETFNALDADRARPRADDVRTHAV